MRSSLPEKYLRSRPLDNDKPELIRLVKEGKNDTEIAEHFGTNPHLIWQRRKYWNIPQCQEAKQKKLKEDIATYWREGYLPKEIAEAVGLALSTLYVKMRQFKTRDIPRMSFKTDRSTSLHELCQSNNPLNDDDVVLVTRNRVPRWVLVPVEQYHDLVSGDDRA